jgi:hypothetical protein
MARIASTFSCSLSDIYLNRFIALYFTAACFIHIVAIIMTIIMILHIRSKYTAVGKWNLYFIKNFRSSISSILWTSGRKEIVLFFYMYAVVELLAIFLDSAVIPTASSVYPVSFVDSRRARSMLDHVLFRCRLLICHSLLILRSNANCLFDDLFGYLIIGFCLQLPRMLSGSLRHTLVWYRRLTCACLSMHSLVSNLLKTELPCHYGWADALHTLVPLIAPTKLG